MDKQSDKTVVFVHIPKTGGTTLAHIFRQVYKSNNLVYHGYNKQRNKIEAKNFKILSQDQRSSYQLIRGHGVYELHEFFVNPYYVSLVRNPIERVISLYYFIMNSKFINENNTDPDTRKCIDEKLTLEECIEKKLIPGMINGQTQSFLKSKNSPYPSTFNELEEAKKNIETDFQVLGTMEKFDHFVTLLAKQLEWNHIPTYQPQNRGQNSNSRRKIIEEIPQKTLKLIESHNHLDIDLYQYVAKRFEQIYEANCSDIGLKMLRLKNFTHRKFHILQRRIKLLIN